MELAILIAVIGFAIYMFGMLLHLTFFEGNLSYKLIQFGFWIFGSSMTYIIFIGVIYILEDIEEQQEHEIDNGEYDYEEEEEYERLLRGRR